MKKVWPEVYVVAHTTIDHGMEDYLREVGGLGWLDRVQEGDHPGDEAEDLVEFAGRLCYRSWEPGLNPNITKVRSDHEAYLQNILAQRHGSVLEHVTYSFVFHNVSRILTHELVRHRPGVAISQESLRFVRLTEVPVWIPVWAQQDEELMGHVTALLARMEWLQGWMGQHFQLDNPTVAMPAKKAMTSFMRRFAPEGVTTSIMWTANLRTLRHVIESRTAPGAEEEIRLVFGKVARIMVDELPAIFGDFSLNTDTGAWESKYRKV